METDADVIVVGGGHNGLVAASYLARAGLRVEVLEAQPYFGGLTTSQPIFGDGHLYSVAAAWNGMLQPDIIGDLGLYLDVSLLNPQVIYRGTNGGIYIDTLDPQASQGASQHDGGRSRAGHEGSLELLKDKVSLGAEAIYPLLRAVSISERREAFAAIDPATQKFLSNSMREIFDEFPGVDEVAKCAVAMGAMSVQNAGPDTAGGGFYLSYMASAETNGRRGYWGISPGGMGELSSMLVTAAFEAGAKMTPNTPVVSVEERDGINFVVLEDGSARTSRAVLFSCGIDRACNAVSIPQEQRPAVGRGVSATIHLKLNSQPSYLSEVANALGRSSVGELDFFSCGPSTLDEMAASHSRFAQNTTFSSPLLLSGSTLASSADDAVMYLYVQFVGSDANKDELLNAVLAQLDAVLFDRLSGQVVDSRVATGADFENQLFAPGGHPEHLQMVFPGLIDARPTADFADYTMGKRGVYHGSAGSFPGGLATGLPGRNAAAKLLADMGLSLTGF